MNQERALDRIDLALIGLLQKDARLANKELAAAVGLAPSSCHARVQRLVGEGFLRGFHAEPDLALLGRGLEAMISLQLEHQGPAIETFIERSLGFPEVQEVYQVSGTEDLLVRVAVAGSDHLRRFVLEELFAPGEVRHVETSIVFRHARSHALPIALEPS